MTPRRRRPGRGDLRRHGPRRRGVRRLRRPTPRPASSSLGAHGGVHRQGARRPARPRVPPRPRAPSASTFDVPAAPADDPDPTGRCLILVTPDGERTMNTNLGIAAELSDDDVDADAGRQSSPIVYVEGYLWDSESPKDAIRKAFDSPAPTAPGVASRCPTASASSATTTTFARARRRVGVDVLFANEAEILVLYGRRRRSTRPSTRIAGPPWRSPSSPAARWARSSSSGGERARRARPPRRRVVDTTGAGDLFAAGALYGLARGVDLATCARLGSLAAAEVISHVGARPQASPARARRRRRPAVARRRKPEPGAATCA